MMGKKERHAYLDAIRRRYHRADRKAKSVILDEFCKVCGYNRKYAIRVLPHSHRAGPQAFYNFPINHQSSLGVILKRSCSLL